MPPRMPRTKKEQAPRKVRVSVYLDKDVVQFFKVRAARPGSPKYQTQINAELRLVMEREGKSYGGLLDDEAFIAAVAERVRRGRGRGKK